MIEARSVHDLQLFHYGRGEIQAVHSVKQDNPVHRFKPNGLWLSVEHWDGGWREWCENENFVLGVIVHQVRLSDAANVLWLRSAGDIDDFHYKYASRIFPGIEIMYPDWPAISAQYHGIVIAPYCWERRLDGKASDWYYPWDCASACIWDRAAIGGWAVLNAAAA